MDITDLWEYLLVFLFVVIAICLPVIVLIALFKVGHQKLNDKVLKQDSLVLERGKNRRLFFLLLLPFGWLGLRLLEMTPIWQAIDAMPTIWGSLVWMVYGVSCAYVGSSLALYMKAKIIRR